MSEQRFPPELIEEIASGLKLSKGWQRKNLEYQLRKLPDLVRSFRTLNPRDDPAAAAGQLKRIAERSGDLLKALDFVLPAQGSDLAAASDAEALLMFTYAKQAAPDRKRPEEFLRKGGAAADVRGLIRRLGQLRDAAQAASEASERRRKSMAYRTDRALKMAADHLLGVYHDVVGQAPGMTVDPIEKPISGPGVEFLVQCLRPFGWTPTGNQIRGFIEAYRKRHGALARRGKRASGLMGNPPV
jgi:hypothetical protein